MKSFFTLFILCLGMLFFACQGEQKSAEEKKATPKEEVAVPAKKAEKGNNVSTKATGKSIAAISNNKLSFKDGTELALEKGKTTIFLVRHAEKVTEGENPGLSTKGKQRAEALADIFKAHNLDRVYTTFFQRTIQTIEPITKMMGRFYNAYNPKDLETFAKSVLKNDRGKQVLVVGHSNTTPTLVNLFTGEADKYPQIPEDEFDHFYIVQLDEAGHAEVMELQY